MVRGDMRRITAGIVASAFALAAAGCVTPTPVGDPDGAEAPRMVNPRWTSLPTPEKMGDAFPGFAADAGIEGAAHLVCRVTVAGRLEQCAVAGEAPGELGFGAAALSVSNQFRAEPRSRNGVPVPATVAFAVRFALPPFDPGPAWTGPAPDPEALALARQVAARMPVSLTSGPDAMRLDGVPPERLEKVRRMILTVERESSAEMREARALILARTQSIGDLRTLTTGQRRPSRPNMSDEALARAMDQVTLATQRQNDRLRALYCAQYDCERD